MTRLSSRRFEVGDAVAEVPPPDGYFSRADGSILPTQPRRGKVVRVVTKRDSRNRRILYFEVVWDGLRSPSVHAACRLKRPDSAA